MSETLIKTRDKIIIVHYIGVKGIDERDILQYIDEVAKNLLIPDDESVIQYFIPVKDSSDARVECINPVLVNQERFDETVKKMNELEAKLKQAIKDFDAKENGEQREKRRQEVISEATSNPLKARELLEKAEIIDENGDINERYKM